MTGLRLDIDLEMVSANACELVKRCEARAISVTGVTKAMLGAPELARALSAVGVLADSRIENIERMRGAGVDSPMLLLRSPAPSQLQRVVDAGVMSVNTEIEVITALSCAARAAGRIHEVMVMVELGDLREGLMPDDLHDTIRQTLALPNIHLRGIGANLACRNGIEPSDENMLALTRMVESIEESFDLDIDLISGGNSANLDWALGSGETGRVNNLRLGESILLGTEPLHRVAITGLHTDAFTLVAEVIESQRKPSMPWGSAGQNTFGETLTVQDRGDIWQTIFAVGRQDTDTSDLVAPAGVEILAASSDHLVAATNCRMTSGDEVRFSPGYSALLRSMTSPFVAKNFLPYE